MEILGTDQSHMAVLVTLRADVFDITIGCTTMLMMMFMSLMMIMLIITPF